MYPKRQRIGSRKEVFEVIRKGYFVRGELLSLKVLRRNQGTARFTVVVSTKISKKAVVRNKIKRRIREILRHLTPSMKAGFDIVVLTYPRIIRASYQQIRYDIFFVIQKARLYNGKS